MTTKTMLRFGLMVFEFVVYLLFWLYILFLFAMYDRFIVYCGSIDNPLIGVCRLHDAPPIFILLLAFGTTQALLFRRAWTGFDYGTLKSPNELNHLTVARGISLGYLISFRLWDHARFTSAYLIDSSLVAIDGQSYYDLFPLHEVIVYFPFVKLLQLGLAWSAVLLVAGVYAGALTVAVHYAWQWIKRVTVSLRGRTAHPL